MLLTRGGDGVLESCVRVRRPGDAAPGHAGHPVRDRLGDQDVHRRARWSAWSVTGWLAFETPVVDVLPRTGGPSTLRPEVTVHHLLCHTSGIADYCEEDEDSPAYLADYADLWRELPSYTMSGRPTSCRSSATCRRTAPGRALPVLQRRLHRARSGRRGGHRSGRTPKWCSSGSSSLPGCPPAASSGSTRRCPTWRTATCRATARSPVAHQHLLGPGHRRRGRRGDLHRARPGPVPARVRGRDAARRPARWRAGPARRRRRRLLRGTACTSTPTADVATAAAIPASR